MRWRPSSAPARSAARKSPRSRSSACYCTAKASRAGIWRSAGSRSPLPNRRGELCGKTRIKCGNEAPVLAGRSSGTTNLLVGARSYGKPSDLGC